MSLMKQRIAFHSQKGSSSSLKGTDRGMNFVSSKPKHNYFPSVTTTQSQRHTPSPISNRFQQVPAGNSFSLNNYKNQTQLLQASKGAKAISVNRKGKSLDYSHNDMSLNETKMSTMSIYKLKLKPSKINVRSGTPNLSKPSMKKLNVSDIKQTSKPNSMQISTGIRSKQPVKSASPIFMPTKPNMKANHGVFSAKKILGNFIRKKPQLQGSSKKIGNVSFTQQSNYSQIMTQKKHLEITTSISQPSIKEKDKGSTSSDSLVTKDMTPKIQKAERQEQQPLKPRKKIKCMHDLSKTGLSGDEKKVNQDNYFIFKNFSNHWDYIYMGVCDGHGYYGHEVSGYIKENLPMDLNHAIQEHKLNILTDSLENVINQTFSTENYNLLTNTMIDSKLSGTTCCTAVYTPEKMIIANIGDSRAVIGRLVNQKWEHKNLSRDHKPSEKDEAERIHKFGGRIRPMRDDDGSFIGPLRVYMKDKDMPGLSMTRSFGDYFASTAGCISEPEVTEHILTPDDKFLIIASDGLWEFIESQEVVDIAKDFYLNDDIVGCCEYLYKESCKRWLHEEEDVIDDITMIIVFFE